MTESIWMEQLKAYSRHIASLGQQIAAEHARVTNWLLHQRGLYALGKLCCFGIALLAVCVHCKQAPTNGILADRLVTAKKGKNAKSARCQLAACEDRCRHLMGCKTVRAHVIQTRAWPCEGELPLLLPLGCIVQAFCMCISRMSCFAARSIYGTCKFGFLVLQPCVSVAGFVPVRTGAKLVLMAVSSMQAFEQGHATIWTSCTAAGLGCQT